LDGIAFNIERCVEKLKTLEKNLNDRSKQEHPRGKRPTLEGVNKSIANILSVEHMKELFVWNVWKEENGGSSRNCVHACYNLNHTTF
jgi:hypothetical protein